MEYLKVVNKNEDSNEGQFNKKIKLINKYDDSLEAEEKSQIQNIYHNPFNTTSIIIIILIIIFLFLVFIYQNIIIPDIRELTKNNNHFNKEKEEINKDEEILEKEKNLTDEELESITTEKIPSLQDVYKIEIFPSREKSFKKAKNFLENNIKGILLRNISSLSNQNPIATGIIPVYNSKNYISRAIKSIQNQNILNIEIILVDDKSTDDTLSFIKEIQKEDQRIKIISNKKNMGILYSRCIGALSAKGKYIFPLDNDDMFLDEDVFQTITNIAEKGFFDIVEFKGIESKKGENDDILKNKIGDAKFANRPLNLVLYQPALGNYQIWPTNIINKYHVEVVYLWGKCIRTEIYQKTINKLGKEKYSLHIVRYEDVLFNYALCNVARSYKFVGKYGIFNIYRANSPSRVRTRIKDLIYHIYYLDIMLDFVQDRVENKKILGVFVLYLLSRNVLKQALKLNPDIHNKFITCIDKILKMEKISNNFKIEIRQKGKKLDFINYPF